MTRWLFAALAILLLVALLADKPREIVPCVSTVELWAQPEGVSPSNQGSNGE